MVDDKKDNKTLGMKGTKLGVKLGDKLSVNPSAIKPTSNFSSSKGRVVVVTKSAKGHSKPESQSAKPSDSSFSGLTDKERDKRMHAIKMAEQERKFQEEIKRIADVEAAQKIAEEDEESGQEASHDFSSQGDDVRVTEHTPVRNDNAQVRKPIQKLDMSALLNKGKVKNLDAMYKAEKPKVEELPEVQKPAASPAHVKHSAFKPKVEAAPYKKTAAEEEASNVSKKDAFKPAFKKLSVSQLMMVDSEEGTGNAMSRRRSLASIKRARDKVKRKMMGDQKPQEKLVREVSVPDFITVQDLSGRMAEKAADVIKALMKLGMLVTVNQSIDADTAELVISEFGHKIKRVTEAEIEITLLQKVEDDLALLKPRSPVVTIMGHVDHGKTSLLDALRNTDVVASEAGGITQHIGAYQVTLSDDRSITFLDTPGHEAFTAMRMRGAKVTDIVVLVVAADDGIMQQTVEAISHAKAAQVPIIVAINKIDKPGANSQKVQNELFVHGIIPEEMGGDSIIVEVSAKQKINLDKLEEAILLQAEMLDLKANPDRFAEGAVIEAKVDKGRGVVATLLVQKGALKVGDIVVAGLTWGKIRALINDKGRSVDMALPSAPIEVLGLEQAPTAGDEFTVVTNEKTARDLIALRMEKEKQRKLVASKPASLDSLFKLAKNHGVQSLGVIVKADVQGSLEAITNSLHKLGTDEISVRVLHSAVGGITESDITLATASQSIVIGFNVRANAQARELARVNGIDIKYYSIIYNLVDEIKAAMSGMLSPFVKEEILGYVDVRQVFNLTKYGKIAGCYVTEGIVKRAAHARIIRDNVVIYEGKLKALKRFKDDVKEVNSGFECGLSFENYEDLKVGDKIEIYELTEQNRTL
ncbi:MAG: translation initiation factor IF-2 [Alphaproteobacteria bacterium]